jgi:hypothetical protein
MPGAGLHQGRAGDQVRHGGFEGLHGTEPGGGAMMPKRIQLKRVKGWRMPENTVKVARGATIGWGNPFKVPEDGDRAEVTEKFRQALLSGKLSYSVEDVRRELAGKDLACFCDFSGPCHGDVLLQVANERGGSDGR